VFTKPNIINLRTLTLLSLALTFAFLANFAYSQTWSDPSEAPPGGNAYAPLNASNANQTKGGDPATFGPGDAMITAGIFRAAAPSASVRAAEYCDYDGNNCFTPTSGGGGSLPSCADGEVLKSQGGAWVCGTDDTGSGGGGCAMHYTTRSPGCEVQNWSSCPSGYTQYNQQSVYCANGDPGGGNRNVTYCQRQYCASDTDTDLVNGVHNAYDCLNEGGDLGSSLCRFSNTSSCPSGWTEDGSGTIFGQPWVTCY